MCYFRKVAGSWLVKCFSHSSIQMHQASVRLIGRACQYVDCWMFNWVNLQLMPVLMCICVCVCLFKRSFGWFQCTVAQGYRYSVKELLSISAENAVSMCMWVPEARPDPGPEPLPATDETQSTSLLCLHSPLGRLTCLPPGSFGFELQNRT